jgi:LacI family transcriptional regulator
MAPTTPKRISQTQIANELGYSQALVSMVLNSRKQGISEKAYQRIWDYATTHGYSPRGMSIDSVKEKSDSTTIGYILRSPLKLAKKTNFFNHVHQGLHDYLDNYNIKTVFLGAEDNIDIDQLPKLEIFNSSVKGVAILGEVQPKFLEGIRKIGLPIVYISSRATGKCHSVLANEAESASILVDHLVELGHTRFAWVGGDKALGRHKDRHSGVINSLEGHGLTIDPRFDVCLQSANRMVGSEAAQIIIDAAQAYPPTAWICSNGLMARGALSHLFQNGYRVPRDISVTAIDMTNVCIEEKPMITCASTAGEDMGSEAGRLLIDSTEGHVKALIDITLPSKFRDLDSTGPAATVALTDK